MTTTLKQIGRGRRFAIADALSALSLLGTSMAYAQSTSTLTAAQETQAAQVAQETEQINTTNGYVSDSPQVLKSDGLSASEINYVESMIQSYDAQYALTSSAPSGGLATQPISTSGSSITPDTPIWDTLAKYTDQLAMLYEGAQSKIGWQHMMYRHNWENLGAAQTAVEITVHQAQTYGVQSNGRYAYYKWFTTTVPFESWSVEIMIVVNPGNATGTNYLGDGSVVTGYPVAGSYVTETWNGTPNTSIVPWWINEGQYAQTLN